MSPTDTRRPAAKQVTHLAPEQIRRLFPTYANLELSDAEINALALPKQAELLAGLNYRQKYQLLRKSDETVRLLRQMSPEDLFFTVEAAGRTDAMDLVLSATPEQLTHILDMTCWDKDEFEPGEMLDWLGYMIQVDPERAMGKLRTLDTELVLLMLARFIRVRRMEWSDDRRELEENFFSLDDFFQFEFVDPESSQNERLHVFLKTLYTLNHELYKTILEALIWELPSNLEEHGLRSRSERMADRGYPEYLDALGLFAQIDPAAFKRRLTGLEREKPVVALDAGLPVYYGELLDDRSFLARVLAQVPQTVQNTLHAELVYLANRLIVARRSLTDLERVRDALAEVRQTLSLGLDYLSDGDAGTAAGLLPRVAMSEIFRAGFWLTMALHTRTRMFFERHLDALGQRGKSLLAPTARETLTALLRKPPLYFTGADPACALPETRPFAALSELHQAERQLARTEFLFDFHFVTLALNPAELVKGVYDIRIDELDPDIRLAKVFLTTYARARLGGEARYLPLSRGEFEEFLSQTLVPAPRGFTLREDFGDALAQWVGHYVASKPPAYQELAQQWAGQVAGLYGNMAQDISGLESRQAISLSRLLLVGS